MMFPSKRVRIMVATKPIDFSPAVMHTLGLMVSQLMPDQNELKLSVREMINAHQSSV